MDQTEQLRRFQASALHLLLFLVFVHTIPAPWILPVAAGSAPIAALLAFAIASLFTFDGEGVAMGLTVLLPALIYTALAWWLGWLTAKALARLPSRVRLVATTLVVLLPLCSVYFPVFLADGHNSSASLNLPGLILDFLSPAVALSYWIAFHLLVLMLYVTAFLQKSDALAAFAIRRGGAAVKLTALSFVLTITFYNYEIVLCRPFAAIGSAAAQLCVARSDQTRARYWYERAAQNGNRDATLWLIENTPDRRERLRWLTAGAQAGDPAVQFKLARHLQRYGGAESQSAARQWLESSAAGDYGPAQQQLAEAMTEEVLSSGSRELLSTRNALLEAAAGNGSLVAMQRLADQYTRGSMGYPVDMDQAVHWYQKLLSRESIQDEPTTEGADQSTYLAQLQQIATWQAGLQAGERQITLELARLYLQSPLPGPGVRELGMKLFEGIALNDAAARQELILMLRTGTDGADRDPVAARKWLLIAAEDGDVNAMDRVASNYLDGSEGFPVDYPEARRWISALIIHYHNLAGDDAQSQATALEKHLTYVDRLEEIAGARLLGEQDLTQLAAQSDAGSHYRYALQLLAGHGAGRRAEAVSRLQTASDLGHAEAAWRLVQIYERGFPAELNPAAARRELERAAQRHHYHATRELAARYEYGKKGFARDLPRAISMYEEALTAGHDNRYSWNLDPENYNHFKWLESRLKQAQLKLANL